jgi:plastocyanin
MKKIAALGLPLILVGALALIGCGKNPGGSASTSTSGPGPQVTTIGMDASTFTTPHAVSVKSGQAITLDDTVNGGGTHILCIGTGTGGANNCDQSGNGPSELYGSGKTVNSGDKPTVTFNQTGTYRLICTIHSGMYVDITVQ